MGDFDLDSLTLATSSYIDATEGHNGESYVYAVQDGKMWMVCRGLAMWDLWNHFSACWSSTGCWSRRCSFDAVFMRPLRNIERKKKTIVQTKKIRVLNNIKNVCSFI